ncbi:MAG: Tim10/DDP family zinc finger-domain-containing protein, partial [Olpidium bornovanus]
AAHKGCPAEPEKRSLENPQTPNAPTAIPGETKGGRGILRGAQLRALSGYREKEEKVAAQNRPGVADCGRPNDPESAPANETGRWEIERPGRRARVASPIGDEEFDEETKQELQRFLEGENAKARLQQTIHMFTELCWDKCVTKISSRFSGNEETCVVNCVERFLDSSVHIGTRLDEQQQRQ